MRVSRARSRSVLAATALIAAAGCIDLGTDPPALDAPEVEALLADAFARWKSGAGCTDGPALFLSVASGEHSSPWACGAMEHYARIPRVPTENGAGSIDIDNLVATWISSYVVNASVRAGLRAIDDGTVDLDQLGPNRNLRARAYGRFMQGLAHATIAALYDSGFVYDETTDSSVPLRGYGAVMDAALGYFADAAALAQSGSFTVPATWMSQDIPSGTLAQLARAMAARYRAAVARTPAERAAVDWEAVRADAAAGVTTDWLVVADCPAIRFCNEALLYRLHPNWQTQNNWVAGMADTSGAYQAWIDTPLADKLPFVIHTPDTRWPRGPDEATQLANPGEYYRMNSGGTRIWERPDRGTWRWSYYSQANEPYATILANGTGAIPFVTVREMKALVAEADYRAGNLAAVANFVNETRTLHGLLATDAGGTNTSCVPRLPNGDCGDLWEMFKWEKRVETQFAGALRLGWYFDGRGWGDLLEGTMLQLPVPYREMQLLGRSPYNFGGVGGSSAAPTGTYDYCGTGGC